MKTPKYPVRDDCHPMGINQIDKEKLKGIPKGSTIAILGDPDSSSELLLHALASTGRKTNYITTNRSKNTIIEDINLFAKEQDREEYFNEDDVIIRDVHNSAEDYDDIIRKATSTTKEGNLIIDSFSNINDPKDKFKMARMIHQKINYSNGLAYLYFVNNDIKQLTRKEQEILQLVDGVFNIKTEKLEKGSTENNLYINKLRGKDTPKRAISLVFGKTLSISTTDDIG